MAAPIPVKSYCLLLFKKYIFVKKPRNNLATVLGPVEIYEISELLLRAWHNKYYLIMFLTRIPKWGLPFFPFVS
jgi:hypothetical protein